MVEVKKADFEVVVLRSPTNCRIYPHPNVEPMMSACLRKNLSLSLLGEKRRMMPFLESLEMIRNIASDSVNRIPAKRMGDTSPKALFTIENVVPHTEVRIIRIKIARVFLDCFGMGEDNRGIRLEVPHCIFLIMRVIARNPLADDAKIPLIVADLYPLTHTFRGFLHRASRLLAMTVENSLA